jgi:hypothetical protein
MKKSFAHPWAIFSATLSIVFASCALAPINAYADTAYQLLRGTSDALPGTLDVQILTNEDHIATGFQAVTEEKTETYGLTNLSEGIVLMNYQNHDVAILKSTDFDPSHGGTLQITYLRNALNNSYRTLVVDLVRNGDQWQLMANDQSGHHVVTRAFLKAKKVLGQVVGIDSVTLLP